MESPCIKIEIPENLEFPPETPAQNPNPDQKTYQDHGISKQRERKAKCGKWAFCCWTFVVLTAMTIGLIYLGLCLQENWNVEDTTVTLKGRPWNSNSTHLAQTGNGSFPTLSEAQKEEEDADGHAEFGQTMEDIAELEREFPGVRFKVPAHLEVSREKVKELSSEVPSREITRQKLRQQVAKQLRQHEEIKMKMTRVLDDLEGQIADLQVEMNLFHEELNTISFINDGMKRLLLHFSLNHTAPPISMTMAVPPTCAPPPPPLLSAPRFYEHENKAGVWFEPSPGWESKCVNMPGYFVKVASSVKLGSHCLLVCAGSDCKKDPWVHSGISEKECIELHSNSSGLDKLTEIEFNDQIRSFRLCQKK